jgi:ABC-type glycerol-3-phosphate transport system permease component
MFVLALLWIVPLLWMTDTAFKPKAEIFSSPPTWIPTQFTLYNIKELFSDWPYLRWLSRSFFVALMSTGISLVVSTLAAFSFSRLFWKGRDAVFMILMAFMLLPWQVNIMPLFFTMKTFGFLNTVQGVAFPIIAMPIGVFLLRQFFINIPRDMEDVARIDGCSNFAILLKVIVPMSKPVFGAYGIFIFNWAWNEFFWSSICLSSERMQTLSVGLRSLQGSFDINYGLFMAGAFMAALPSFIIFVLLRKHIIRGFTLSGGLKG